MPLRRILDIRKNVFNEVKVSGYDEELYLFLVFVLKGV